MNFQNDKIKLDYNNMMSTFIGEKGISENDFIKLDIEHKTKKATEQMTVKREQGKMDFLNLPYNQDEVVENILQYVEEVKDEFETFVVLGIGGSALGPISVQQALNHPFYNELSKEKRKYPKFYVADNVDPEKLSYLFDIIDIENTLFNCISKSGSTSETMSQFMIIKQMLEDKLGKEKSKKNIVCTTDAKNGNLIKIATEEGYKTFVVPAGVGGRFSQLTPVGLLPAAMCGINIKQLLAGAKFMDELCTKDSNNIAYKFATLQYISMLKGKNIAVMMPYCDSLKYISDWFCQLWGESLGKKYDLQNNEVFVGQTPVKALGATDQHSQVQLYVEGPDDKVITLIGIEKFKREIQIPKIYEEMPSIGFLGGVNQSDLIKTEQLATEYALMKAQKSNMTITLEEVNEFTLGQLLFMFEVATAYTGELLNINTFDQPGVEEGKNATYAMFNRPGYEEKKLEIENRPKKEDKYTI